MKRIACLLAALLLLLPPLACRAGPEEDETLRIGVALYQQEDTFIGTVVRELQRVALEKEQELNVKINLYITDGKESQAVQNEQVDRFLQRRYDVICTAGRTPIMRGSPQETPAYCRESWCWMRGEPEGRSWIATATAYCNM